ncbi:hypothetical protein AB0D38_20610 [Streptomyces sp. NPDC048279]|uniref:hypothetical protein n=1 Tax=Streptomyces sp. NPDC048279 TaxID=3154714 RepID=UPI003434D0D8
MTRSRVRTLTGRLATVGIATSSATPNGTNGWYQLCSQGTYSSEVQYADPDGSGPATGMTSVVAMPGQCVPIHLDGAPVEAFGARCA